MTIKINRELCDGCETCISACAYDAIDMTDETASINDNCIVCGLCIPACPMEAISRDVKRVDIDPSEWSGIWVFAEMDRRGIKKVTLELLGEAKRLSQTRDTHVTALLFGYGLAPYSNLLFRHGADRIYLLDDQRLESFSLDYYSSLLVRAVQRYRPEILLMGATTNGRLLAPSVAVKLGTGLTADCTELSITPEGELKQTRPAFGGNIMASILCAGTRPQMATVRPNVMEKSEQESWREGDIIRLDWKDGDLENRVQMIDFIAADIEKINLESAELIVAGGFGVGAAEKFSIIEDLAESMGAAIGCTRKVVDAGWMPHDRQVGQTGKTVRPRIYIACGISGAIQHQMGMNHSDTVIAINSDPKAPIFNMVDYGIVGDLFEVIPLLKEKLTPIIRKA
jgi:electron transfer flavoprotein alpha subunit